MAWLLYKTANSLCLALTHDRSLSLPGSCAWPLTLLDWLLYLTAYSLGQALRHDRSFFWPGSYTWPLTLLTWHLCMTAHSLDLSIIHGHSLTWPGSYTWTLTLLAWCECVFVIPDITINFHWSGKILDCLLRKQLYDRINSLSVAFAFIKLF